MRLKIFGWVLTNEPQTIYNVMTDHNGDLLKLKKMECYLCNITGYSSLGRKQIKCCLNCSQFICQYHNNEDDGYNPVCIVCSSYGHHPKWKGVVDNDPKPGDGNWMCIKCAYSYCGMSPSKFKQSRGREPGRIERHI